MSCKSTRLKASKEITRHDDYDLWVDTTSSTSPSWTNTISVEGAEFQGSLTRPDIPYTLYVSTSYLLLVPREVARVHPNFPPMPDPPQRYKLQHSDYLANEYKQKYNKEPKFDYKNVGFGLDDSEVVVAALLDGGEFVANWEFQALFRGANDQLMDNSGDSELCFEIMQRDLRAAAVATDA